MRQNENTMLAGPSVILVPYKREHVLKYHEWMTSPFLQEMTASEPLSLEEEYAMQVSWHEDEDKCTFIIMVPLDQSPDRAPCPQEIKSNSVMIGDVNLFFNDDQDRSFAEIEIMIAEEAYRRTGRGLEALKMMMGYALRELGIRTFHAKISLNNAPSIRLFTEKLGFCRVSESAVFQEITLEWTLNNSCSETKVDSDYGSTITAEQHEQIQHVYQDLLGFWNKVEHTAWTEA